MSTKTRHYLEQFIPELDDLVEKGVFTKDEVSNIMKKRTNFEHRLNSRGSSINDYVKYIQYETNVEKLRVKRVHRILQTNKTNNLKFWAMYLNFLKNRGVSTSYKKIHSVYNTLLKLHPNNVNIWISCAKYEYEKHANFKSCRSVFQNGLRFNPDVSKLWFEYIKFELNFITKLINRRKVMNLINEREQELDMLNEAKEKGPNDENEDNDDQDSNIKTISTGDAMKDKLNELPEADMNMLGSQETNPALRGDIALTIFDIGMKSLGEHYLKKQKGYYAVADKTTNKELKKEAIEYLYKESQKYIELFDQFKDLQRDYLINHILQYWKFEHHDISLKEEFPEYYLMNMFIDITLNIRYMTLENLDIDQLQLSVKKYIAYKSKLPEKDSKQLQTKYKDYIKSTFLDNIEEEEDSRVKILDLIVKKL
ncbi:hypothetical protein RI543_000027 [Arxiozyma heterogenica]|uniref:U3 small nucleolar RNA-associated protein 6 N-terminal domain-containing protein n=1 Tax=Arxiozyma heterogenica TaxID=278026 RepID=A0AAN7ZTJ9_9SACH|nr:hypothetical protein RI543_000027 [Kazachstania heterogenica]